jgi:hypothetical protein
MNLKINPRYQDLAGQKFGRLTVIGLASSGPQGGKRKWQCRCDCGADVIVLGESLVCGETKSCRCLRADIMRATAIGQRKPDFMVRRVRKDYMASAKDRGHIFDLSDEQFRSLILGNCAYCGAVPSAKLARYQATDFRYNGIDRIDNSIGYCPGNVATACTTCNRAKGTMGHSDFMKWIRRVAEFQTGRTSNAFVETQKSQSNHAGLAAA